MNVSPWNHHDNQHNKANMQDHLLLKHTINKVSRSFILNSLTFTIAAISHCVYAQDVAPNLAISTTERSPEKTTANDLSKLETIVVNVRRRAEEEQKVPATVTVIKGNELEESKIYQVQDLQQLLPNFTSQFIHARQSSVAIRGIGNNTANEGLESSVGIYLDNVYLGLPGQAVFDLLDIEQIDLLRGPQGTLFGLCCTNLLKADFT
ncbi:TonB-dependent receptor plug domain-containing protein [Acinetobacter junii]|uniref:TonB-dependent receptor plug domain-containing protein n=1 Tax=Acinetobacter junii TaxID=40215 RepID=UPI003AF46065